MTSERERMLAGAAYDPRDAELVALRRRARRLVKAYNDTLEAQALRRARLLRALIPGAGPGIAIEPPFHCDYGTHVTIGDGVFANFGCVFLDCAPITIGAQTQLGPAVQLYTATHPIDAAARVAGPEGALPIAVGRRVWLGGGTIVLPGVTIGDDTVIGAGSVVTRDVPAGVIAVGNPCRVLRAIDERDAQKANARDRQG